MNTINLNRFSNTSCETLKEMTDSEIHSLSLIEKIERFLIIEGYTNHETCRKIEVCDIHSIGSDSFEFNVVSTKKHCKKPSFYHAFVADEIHGNCKCVCFGNC